MVITHNCLLPRKVGNQFLETTLLLPINSSYNCSYPRFKLVTAQPGKHSYIHKYIVLATWVSCNTYNSSNNEPTRSPRCRIPGIGTKFKYRLSGGKLSGSIEDVPHFRFWSEPFTVLGKNKFLYRLIVCIARMHNWFNYWR